MRIRNIMLRRVFELLFLLSVSQLLACGGYNSNTTGGTSGTTVVNGTVSSVTLTSVLNGTGGTQTATAVTLTVPLGTNSLVLCGDQRTRFTMNSAVQVSYTGGTYCSSLVSVTP
jgi:hypothetical protein